MKRVISLTVLVMAILGAKTAYASDHRYLVQTMAGFETLQRQCSTRGCTVFRNGHADLTGLYLVGAPGSTDSSLYLEVLRALPGVVNVRMALPSLFGTANVIARTTLDRSGLQLLCLLHACTVLRNLDGTAGHLFLVKLLNVLDPIVSLGAFRLLPGILNAELDQLLTIASGTAEAAGPPAALFQNAPFSYYGSTVWMGYATQPAAGIIRLAEAQNHFSAAGAGIIADIDTGVDPTHPALSGVLLPGYDFTRNQSGGSELEDLPGPAAPTDPNSAQAARVNQYSVAMVDQYSVAMVDGPAYAAFGHGTEVAGILHLVAPQATILPLKAFHSDGTGLLSDILRAIYFAAQNDARVVNMSFDLRTYSPELATAITSAVDQGIVFAASAGNDGQQTVVYPAGLTNVMGVASTNNFDQRSSFSNYGNNIVWIAAPGEGIVTTYPFRTYAAVWGTSFSSPFVSGGASLLLSVAPGSNQDAASRAISAGHPLTQSGMGNGRLDLYGALDSNP
jgi:Subtilase family